jgi:hypothetical protein
MKPKLKAPGPSLLTLKYDEPLSSYAFKFNLRRYHMFGAGGGGLEMPGDAMLGRGLHSSTFQLNLSRF